MGAKIGTAAAWDRKQENSLTHLGTERMQAKSEALKTQLWNPDSASSQDQAHNSHCHLDITQQPLHSSECGKNECRREDTSYSILLFSLGHI